MAGRITRKIMKKDRIIHVYNWDTRELENDVNITATVKELTAYMAGMQEAYTRLGKNYRLTWENA